MTCTAHHETIEEAVEVSVVMTCTTHHETIEAAVEVRVVITCTIHHESAEVAVAMILAIQLHSAASDSKAENHFLRSNKASYILYCILMKYISW